jgi:hypothetical protein
MHRKLAESSSWCHSSRHPRLARQLRQVHKALPNQPTAAGLFCPSQLIAAADQAIQRYKRATWTMLHGPNLNESNWNTRRRASIETSWPSSGHNAATHLLNSPACNIRHQRSPIAVECGASRYTACRPWWMGNHKEIPSLRARSRARD